MSKWLKIYLGTLLSAFRAQSELAIENLALRQQLATLKSRNPRPKLSNSDRLFWVVISHLWSNWHAGLHIVQPATVIRWHRMGFKLYWKRKSRRLGRPGTDLEVKQLVQKTSRENPLWGAPRVHGELLKLGIQVSQATVSKYLVRSKKPPSQTWRTFLDNHATDLISIDFLTVPTATFRVLYVLVILSHERRRILHFNVTENPTAAWTSRQLLDACGSDEQPRFLLRDRDGVYGKLFSRQAVALGITEVVTAPRSPWQNAYVECVIGSIRRECLNHLIVLTDRQLKRILLEYVDYYNRVRTHLSLDKDAPDYRLKKPPDVGKIVRIRRVGGLHHEYTRMAA
ncbi:MAG: transposase [Gammaproteobacteria bacterium]|nr:transposase [Gammaproteobacteria bacterium]